MWSYFFSFAAQCATSSKQAVAVARFSCNLSQMLRATVAGDVGASDLARSMVSKERDDVSFLFQRTRICIATYQ